MLISTIASGLNAWAGSCTTAPAANGWNYMSRPTEEERFRDRHAHAYVASSAINYTFETSDHLRVAARGSTLACEGSGGHEIAAIAGFSLNVAELPPASGIAVALNDGGPMIYSPGLARYEFQRTADAHLSAPVTG